MSWLILVLAMHLQGDGVASGFMQDIKLPPASSSPTGPSKAEVSRVTFTHDANVPGDILHHLPPRVQARLVKLHKHGAKIAIYYLFEPPT